MRIFVNDEISKYMKNLVPFIFLLAFLVSGCSQEEALKDGLSASNGRIFTTSFGQNESRTFVKDGYLSRWTANDRISLFDSNTQNLEYKFDGKADDDRGTFSLVNKPEGTGGSLATNYAVYPYSEDVKITTDGVITTILPSEQHYANNSFGLGDNTMLAVTQDTHDTFLNFKNVGGCLKLQLYGNDVTVKSITLKGNNSEKLAGKATITAAYDKTPMVSIADDATTTITLDCGEEGVEIGTTIDKATAFWMVLPPITFEKGITITITDVNGGILTRSISDEIVVVRNIVKTLAALTIEMINDDTPYVTFTAAAKQTLTMTKAVENLEYSVGGGEWYKLGTTKVEFGDVNGNLRLRGLNDKGTATDAYTNYSQIKFGAFNVPVECSGDIRTLLDYENYLTVNTKNARFCKLFYQCSCLVSSPDLPATDLASYCYYGMFWGCSKLSQAPVLPATSLTEYCYTYMFDDCRKLVKAPKLPATTLAKECYSSMFTSCTSLTQAPSLPATTLAEDCYGFMFVGTGLTEAPELPATNLAKGCYSEMFKDCVSLTQAPILPATTLAVNCYSEMFEGCTSLVQAPALPATTLVSGCYMYMFYGCTSLTKAPELLARTFAIDCYTKMFAGCSQLNSITMLGIYSYDASMCTDGWVEGVASNGTFIKSNAMRSLPSGSSGIPSGWTITSK
jgi:hypothetical protein